MWWLSFALAGTWGDLDTALSRYIQPALNAGRLHTVSLAIVRGDEVHQLVLGAPIEPDARFEIGSISKAFTGELLAQAVARGEVELTDSLHKHLPGAPKWAKKVTLYQLATHTSGLPRLPAGFQGQPSSDPYRAWGDVELLASLEATELQPPGTYRYSNLGAALLGRALEQASNKTWPVLLTERIAGPLGMTQTDVDRSTPIPGHAASGRVVPPWTLNAFDATGGIQSTTSDMARWLQAHLNPKSPLSPSMALASRSHHHDRETDLGLLWHRTAQGMVWHNGETGGFHSLVVFSPGRDIGVVALGDTASALVEEVGFAALQIAEGMKPEALKLRPATPLPLHFLAAHAGRYGPVQIALEAGALWLKLDGQPAYRMWATDATHFYLLEAPVDLTFRGGSLVFEQAGEPRQEWKRGKG